MAHIAVAVALIAVCAWISVPAAVPFTLQTFGIFLCSALLGARRGLIAVACYILLGAIGLPVFAGMNAGFGVLAGATGGYITGFLPAAVIAGWKSGSRSRIEVDIIFMLLGLAVCYAFGTLWYALEYLGGMSGVGAALMTCVVPYIVADLLKILFAAVITKRLRKIVDR